MILRRIYMLVPSRHHAEEVVRDLMVARVNRQRIHTVARSAAYLKGLPAARIRQRDGFTAQLDSWFWDINLLLFFAAIAILLIGVWASEWLLVAGCLTLLLASALLGYYYSGQVQQAHIDDFDVPLKHGEFLLLVDLPRWRVSQVERSIRQQHPEVELGGVGWGIDALGI
ncbi:MAG: hypothetical protein JAY85_06945 [Candidatus Thiodiazotropha weberae]|uniref:Uncharacterized protein n=1 Tax=Candidatus Thiodiazotropha endoloripes TaxID=1818881 RepID=A0A1E2UN54_9GAMM|nr:hypothetical protein [Candidatus Thiodiazotropha endoloripes]MCG7898180.1 hypothetical protein [Candidatus Thiodiazotropha weberae]MCG7903128.1 hypothetical protein [Candidatus Thiodiazotropha weberae]MCG7915090.1 hypothetical protein [Candidatus Thiodiazotropha weberae]ODB84499.1 hypothetical protein A3193_17035 [Candidatus Thiodiazotropha endoloripes]ODB91135.1 hypothetical protein A3195_06875 [Candidatus Thiodiazotropha endoloripes]